METFSALLAICAGNSPVTGEFPTQRPVTRSFDVFFDLRPIYGWVNNREAGDFRRHRAHYDVILMNSFECYMPVMNPGPQSLKATVHHALTTRPSSIRQKKETHMRS